MKQLACALFALVASAAAVHAGARYTNGVSVNTTSRSGGGPLAAARADGSTHTNIQIEAYGTNSYVGAYVLITDPAGVFAYCWTNNPGLTQLLAAASNDAQVFVYWDTTGQCTNVYVTNDSGLAPKAP